MNPRLDVEDVNIGGDDESVGIEGASHGGQLCRGWRRGAMAGAESAEGARGDSMRSFVGRFPAGGETTAEVSGKGKIGRKAGFDRRAASRTISGRRR